MNLRRHSLSTLTRNSRRISARLRLSTRDLGRKVTSLDISVVNRRSGFAGLGVRDRSSDSGDNGGGVDRGRDAGLGVWVHGHRAGADGVDGAAGAGDYGCFGVG